MKKFAYCQAGCWIDGSRGHYAVSYLVEIALSNPGFLRGRNRSETVYQRNEARVIVRAYNRGDDTVTYTRRTRSGRHKETVDNVAGQIIDQGGLAEAAEDFLNTLAPEGYSFGWLDGEFFLASAEWWEEAMPG